MGSSEGCQTGTPLIQLPSPLDPGGDHTEFSLMNDLKTAERNSLGKNLKNLM